jgi:predicted AlkP superfamily pyrophosphatase or phosphodiesterase
MTRSILLALALAAALRAQHIPVLLISIDGMRPDYISDADAHKLKIPNLRRMMAEGAMASGVRGVLPTVTYPSHTTLVTGVAPDRHRICSNNTFDPLRRNFDGWYWYASDIGVPTLWDEAAKAGLITANVHWPVTVGAGFTFNLPQYWRAGTADDRKLFREISTPGLIDALERELGPYADGQDESLPGDQKRAQYAVALLRLKRPGFMTVYLTALDTVEHEFGPFSKEANETLEQLDVEVGRLREAAGPEMVVGVVSDHGFAPLSRNVNLLVRFREAGLIEADDAGHVKSWRATGWQSAVIINPAAPAGTREKVAAVLGAAAKDLALGIARVLSAEQVKTLGGCDAAFFLDWKPGFNVGGNLSGALVTNSERRGTHGLPPDRPEMKSAFLIAGPGVARGSKLPEIDMRDIAPTLASILGVKLSQAEGHVLPVKVLPVKAGAR